MLQVAPTTKQIKADPLGDDVREVYAELRASIARVFAALGTKILRPRDLKNVMGLHQTLAWKIIRIMQTTDPLGDVQYVPGPMGIETFLKAAGERGVPESTLEEVRTAFSRFRSLIDSRAGDRASLELMLGGLREEEQGGGGADWRSLRRAGYRCASSTWGVQVRTRLLCQILTPSAHDDKLMDIALMPASLGLRRIKPGAVFPLHPVAPVVVADNDGQDRETGQTYALDPHGLTVGMPLLSKFCSSPLPDVHVGQRPDGSREHQLGDLPVGGKGIDMFFGFVHRAVASRFRDEHNSYSNTAVTIRMPIETAVIDLWVHDDLLPNREARALLYGELSHVPWHLQRPESAERLSMSEDVETMGRGLVNAPLLDAPQYQDAVGFAFERLNWNPDKYTLYRLRVEYPVIATAMVVQFDLPEYGG